MESTTELVTGGTDLLLAIAGLIATASIRRASHSRFAKTLWLATFSLFALGALLGAIHHSIALNPFLYDTSWSGVLLTLGLMIAVLVTAVCHDLWGEAVARRSLLPMIALAMVFFGVSLAMGQDFRFFVFYEALALIGALVGYAYLARKGAAGAVFMTAGIAITILAAIVQATKAISLSPDYPFDHNAAYHMIQIPGIWALTIGVKRALSAAQPLRDAQAAPR